MWSHESLATRYIVLLFAFDEHRVFSSRWRGCSTCPWWNKSEALAFPNEWEDVRPLTLKSYVAVQWYAIVDCHLTACTLKVTLPKLMGLARCWYVRRDRPVITIKRLRSNELEACVRWLVIGRDEAFYVLSLKELSVHEEIRLLWTFVLIISFQINEARSLWSYESNQKISITWLSTG
jgi:hypothetical protein